MPKSSDPHATGSRPAGCVIDQPPRDTCPHCGNPEFCPTLRATPDRAAKLERLAELSMQPRARFVRAEFELPADATDDDIKRLIDAVNAVAMADERIEAWEIGE